MVRGFSCSAVCGILGFCDSLMVKNPPANSGDAGSIPGSRISPGEGKGTPVFLPEKSCGQRSLVGYCLWSHKESYMI